jgi:phenylalanyl-tRNA synthetase beta chain
VLVAYELRQKAFIFEMEMAGLIAHVPETRTSVPLPKYPSVSRDATLILAKEIETDALLRFIHQMDEPLIEEVRLFDVFTGRPVAQGRKSVSVRIVYRSAQATLEDAAVNEVHRRISDRVVEAFKAELPG